MPWVRAMLRGSQVYARADEEGNLVAPGGRVEVRYRKSDGRLYRAAARNLAITDPTPLPDDTCAPAEEVARDRTAKPKAAAKSGKASAATSAPDMPTADGAQIAYTDGACSGNPGPAGLGSVVFREGQLIERYEYLGKGTNNIAEMMAVIRALEDLDPAQPSLIHTDSTYTIGVAVKGWKAKKNTELVAELRAAMAAHPHARLVKVKGHAGIPLNERADELARTAVELGESARTVTDRAGGD
ncbi:MAG: ribonuclease HI [Deltaproteobacteria bacterium]|nr:ribonuclease HI [Deltaproteobacteria bacterium]